MCIINVTNRFEVNTVFSLASSGCNALELSFCRWTIFCLLCWYIAKLRLLRVLNIHLSQSIVHPYTALHLYHECLKGELVQGYHISFPWHQEQTTLLLLILAEYCLKVRKTASIILASSNIGPSMNSFRETEEK